MRWKQLHEQPIGWEPDLNDGVRLNMRPFVEAGVLRSSFNIHWRKDRGKNPDGSERHNDIHLTLAEKTRRTTRGRPRMSETVLDRLVGCVRAALDYDPNVRFAPVALLWPDEAAQWEPVMDRIGDHLPVVSLGDYDPERPSGPAYWIRCVVARTIDAGLPDEPLDRVPAAASVGASCAPPTHVRRPWRRSPSCNTEANGSHTRTNRDWTVRALLSHTRAWARPARRR